MSTPVTLVSAPTGYGKSTLLSAWAATTGDTVAWLTLDELDNDPRTLWHGIVSSIESATAPGSSARIDLGRVRSDAPVGDELALVDHLITVLEEQDVPFALVLDNVDEIQTTDATAVLERLFRYLPTSMRLVLVGRYDPPLALQRMRTAGHLTEFRSADLQFTRRDITALAEISDIPLSAADGDALYRATAGWPVAVRMALVSMRHAEPAQALKPLINPSSPVADVLVREMLASLHPQLSRFIVRATTSRRIDAALADTLDGTSDGSARLAECVERGLFLEREPGNHNGPVTYRWHDFFHAQCQAHLAASSPTTWRALHRAAAHYWRDRDLEAAVDHALSGGRPSLAAQFIGDRWIELVLSGRHALLRSLCAKIPPPLDETPDLLLLVAVCLFLDGSPAQADLQLRRAHARTAAVQDTTSEATRFALLESLLRIVLALEPPDLGEMARRGAELISHSSPAHDDVATAGAQYIVGQLLARVGEVTVGVALLEASSTIATSRGMETLRLACGAELALAAANQQSTGQARDRARPLIDEARTLGLAGIFPIAPAYLALALDAYQRDDLDSARSLATLASDTSQQADSALRALAQVTLLEIALAAGDPAHAEELHEQVSRHECDPFLPPVWPVVVAALDARWSYAHGDLPAARQFIDTVGSHVMVLEHPASIVATADILRLLGDHSRAGRMLDALPSGAAAQCIAAHRVVAALLAHDAGKEDQAHRLLEQALALGEIDDVRRPFVDHAPALLPMLQTHLQWGTNHLSFCIELIDHLPRVQPSPRVPSYWSLTPREHDVLLYLRSAMTAADIAAAVFVSVNTVKTHQRAIYRKLGVAGRREAVQVATQRGLL